MATYDLMRMRKDLDSMYNELSEFHDSKLYLLNYSFPFIRKQI